MARPGGVALGCGVGRSRPVHRPGATPPRPPNLIACWTGVLTYALLWARSELWRRHQCSVAACVSAGFKCGGSAAVDRCRGGPPELSHGLIGRVYRRVVDPSSYEVAVSVVSGVPEHWRGCGGGRLDAERSSRVRFGRRGPARRGGGIHCEAALLAADEDGESMSGEAASGGRRWPSSWRGDVATRGGEGWGAPGW